MLLVVFNENDFLFSKKNICKELPGSYTIMMDGLDVCLVEDSVVSREGRYVPFLSIASIQLDFVGKHTS